MESTLPSHATTARWRPLAPLFLALLPLGCDLSNTAYAVLENDYPSSATPLVVYQAAFESTSFGAPVSPGSSSAAASALPTSGAPVYVLLAPGWDPAASAAPTSFVVMESSGPYALDVGSTVRIPVSDATFRGNCGAASALSQGEADIVINAYFSSEFTGLRYDAATCTTTFDLDAGSD